MELEMQTWVRSMKELKITVYSRFRYGVVSIVEKRHFKNDYRRSPGVLKLGWTNPRPVVLFPPEGSPYNAHREMFVECDQGTLTMSEALYGDFPTPSQIKEMTEEIRRNPNRNPERAGPNQARPFGFDGPGVREISVTELCHAITSK
jgi:hypothetical protein